MANISMNRIVVACTAWQSSPETDAGDLCKNLFQSFHEMLKLMAKPQL